MASIPNRKLSSDRARRSTVLGVVVNFALALVKGTAGILGNSYALVADAIESLSDLFSSIVVWIGLKVAASPASERHPFGRGRAEGLAALLVSLALFAAAIGIAVHSLHEIRTPHHAPAPFTLIVLVAVVAVKELLFRYVVDVSEDLGSIAVRTDAWHHRSDAITSAAAFVGISIALIGGSGYESADDWAALFAAFIIAFNAWNLLVPTLRELMDAAPDGAIVAAIKEVAGRVPGVVGTHRCWVRKIGFDHFVELDVLVDGELTVREGHDIAHSVRDAVNEHLPQVTRVTVHVEPKDQYGRFKLEWE